MLAATGINPETRDLRDVHNLALRLQSGKLLRMPHDFCTCLTLSRLASTLVASAWLASALAKRAAALALGNSKCERMQPGGLTDILPLRSFQEVRSDLSTVGLN